MEQTLDINNIDSISKTYVVESTDCYTQQRTFKVSRHDDSNFYRNDFSTLDNAINFLRKSGILTFEISLEK